MRRVILCVILMTAVPAVAEVRRTPVSCGDRTETVIVDDDATVEIAVLNAEQEVVDTIDVEQIFGMTFESGQDPIRCCWIQFLWAFVEVYYTAADGRRLGFFIPGGDPVQHRSSPADNATGSI